MRSKKELWQGLPLIAIQLVLDYWTLYQTCLQAWDLRTRLSIYFVYLAIVAVTILFALSDVALLTTYLLNSGNVTTEMIDTMQNALLSPS